MGEGGAETSFACSFFSWINIFNLSLGSGNDHSQDVLSFLPKTTVCFHRSSDITCSLSQAEEEARIKKEEKEERLRKEEEQRQAVLEKARAIEEARRLEEEAKRKAEEEARRKVCMMMITIIIDDNRTFTQNFFTISVSMHCKEVFFPFPFYLLPSSKPIRAMRSNIVSQLRLTVYFTLLFEAETIILNIFLSLTLVIQ